MVFILSKFLIYINEMPPNKKYSFMVINYIKHIILEDSDEDAQRSNQKVALFLDLVP